MEKVHVAEKNKKMDEFLSLLDTQPDQNIVKTESLNVPLNKESLLFGLEYCSQTTHPTKLHLVLGIVINCKALIKDSVSYCKGRKY